MKKLSILFVLFALPMMAQVKFHPGLRGGANFSKFTETGYYYYDNYYGEQFSNMSFTTDFYVGFQANIRFTKRYALQPELTYSRQGSNATYTYEDYYTGIQERQDLKLKAGYISFAVINKIYVVDQFHFLAGPTMDIMTEHSRNFEVNVPIDFGLAVGFGSDITKNFGVEARLKKGIIPVIDNGDGNVTNLVISVGATFSFF